jgi:hypothetical protein
MNYKIYYYNLYLNIKKEYLSTYIYYLIEINYVKFVFVFLQPILKVINSINWKKIILYLSRLSEWTKKKPWSIYGQQNKI